MDWPESKGKPLTFLASIDLASVHETGAVPWLPASGRLLFFYDVENQPWGFDPNDRGGWSVIFAREDAHERAGGSGPLAQHFVQFEKVDSFPNWERFESLGIPIPDEEVDTFIDAKCELFDDDAIHQMSGYPCNVQGDAMELECQLASHGIYCGDSSGYESSEAKISCLRCKRLASASATLKRRRTRCHVG